MIRVGLWLLPSLLLLGCQPDLPPWRLVGLYDASSLATRLGVVDDPEVASAALTLDSTCGAPKAPTGLGIQEWQGMARGLTPTLAIVLERTDGADTPLLRSDVELSILNDHDAPIRLEPAVTSRQLRIQLDGSDPKIRRQLAYGLCLEHLVGRGWTGAEDSDEMKQAFQLAPTSGFERFGFFVGQARPVPALLGTPYACVIGEAPEPDESPEPSRRGGPSTEVGPLDIWGAALPTCANPGLDNVDQVSLRREGQAWTVAWDGKYWGNGRSISLTDADCQLEGTPDPEDRASCDLLASIPYAYPSYPDGVHKYSLLLVPAWQVRQALGGDAGDAVGWLLDHPSRVRVLVRPTEDARDWFDVNARKTPDLLGWGHVEGLVAARSPVLGLGPQGQVVRVGSSSWTNHHAHLQAAFLAGALALVWVLLPGLRRLRDLRTPIPEEPVEYWPETTSRREDQT